jgi:hypothetical protein
VVAGGCTERLGGGTDDGRVAVGVDGVGAAGIDPAGDVAGGESSFFVSVGGSTSVGEVALSPAGGALSVVVTGAGTAICCGAGEAEEASLPLPAGWVVGAVATVVVTGELSFLTSTGLVTTLELSVWPLASEPAAG